MKITTVRSTFTSAIRNPTLLNQYMYYNVGRAKLVGNITGYEILYTLESVICCSNSGKVQDSLVSFRLDPIKPEEVKVFGIWVQRGVNINRFYIDANYYFNLVYQLYWFCCRCRFIC